MPRCTASTSPNTRTLDPRSPTRHRGPLDWAHDESHTTQSSGAGAAIRGAAVVYVSYSLIRGALIGFYPYPFFNPAAVGGYGGVALYCAGMLVGFLVLALLIRWVGNALGARRDAEREAMAP